MDYTDRTGPETAADEDVDVFSDYSEHRERELQVEIRRKNRWNTIVSNITIEPAMFLSMFAMSSTGIIVQNLYLDRICRINFKNNATVCEDFVLNPGDHGDIEKVIDPVATQYNLARGLIETIIPIIYAMFLGSWTDIHGSKFPLMVSLLGYTCSAMAYIMFTLLPDLPPYMILISSAPVSLAGGAVAIVLSAFSYITYITTTENRSFRVGILEAFWFGGAPIGLLVGAKLYAMAGFIPVFIVAGAAQFIAFLYCLLFVQNNTPNCELPARTNPYCPYSDLFNINYVKDTLHAVFRVRDGPRRRLIIMLILTVCLRIVILFGPNNCMFLFVRHQFGWNEQNYTTFTLVESLLGIAGGIIMIASLKVFSLFDATTGLISCVGFVISNFIVAFVPRGSQNAWWLYFAAVWQMLGGMTSIIVRSMLSKLVPKREIGKIFTFVACSETAFPIAAGFIYTSIYANTEQTFPGAFSLFSALLNTIIVVNFIYFYFSGKRHPQMYTPQEDEDSIVAIN